MTRKVSVKPSRGPRTRASMAGSPMGRSSHPLAPTSRARAEPSKNRDTFPASTASTASSRQAVTVTSVRGRRRSATRLKAPARRRNWPWGTRAASSISEWSICSSTRAVCTNPSTYTTRPRRGCSPPTTISRMMTSLQRSKMVRNLAMFTSRQAERKSLSLGSAKATRSSGRPPWRPVKFRQARKIPGNMDVHSPFLLLPGLPIKLMGQAQKKKHPGVGTRGVSQGKILGDNQ